MCGSDADASTCHLRLWLNNSSVHPPTLLPVRCLKYTLSVSPGQLENVPTHCLCLCVSTLKKNIIWIDRSHRHTKQHDAPLWKLFSSSPTFRRSSPLEAASLFSSDGLVETPCSLIPSSSVAVPFGRMLKPPVVTFNAHCSKSYRGKTEMIVCHWSFSKKTGIVCWGNSWILFHG